MTKKSRIAARRGAIAGLLAALLLAPGSTAQVLDDAVLFTAVVPPNVLLVTDNSGSMNHVVWHSAFDPTQTPSCSFYNNSQSYFVPGDFSAGTYTRCGNTREVFTDPNTSPEATRWDGRYLNWYFSDAADAYAAEIADTQNGLTSPCTGSKKFSKYRRSRITALQQVMLDVICEANEGRGETDGIRFGTALFRAPGPENDSNGGYIGEGIDDNTPEHANDMEAHIGTLTGNAWTPLAETLFQVYTYYMSRTETDRPFGRDGLTRFPEYVYAPEPNGVGGLNDSTKAPPDPMQFHCQKSFVIVVTDGAPTRDDFDPTPDPEDTALGFASFGNLIGDYNPDGEVEVPGGCSDCSLYLDDIAKYMQENDFRPDLAGDQVIDTYAVGFTTDAAANDLLAKTADVGNGIFFHSNDADALKDALVQAVLDIIEKTQSFTASTVPASRTVDGADFYTSFFLPLGADPFWQGHLQSYHITAAGDITDKNDNCALDDPSAPAECNSGPFLPGAEPFWDAADQIPAPASRSLFTSKLVAGTATPVDFDTTLLWTDLDLESFAADGDPTTAAPNRTYPDSIALNEEGLADEIIQYIRGCEFGTGVTSADVDALQAQTCVERDWLLADIFHSNPLVVSRPRGFFLDPSYQTFQSTYAQRDRVIVGGSNGGFVHGFHAGDWDASLGVYDEGTGTELFGFMPWYTRQRIKFQAVPNSSAEHYYVDGQLAAADVWEHGSPTDTTKSASEWKTLLVGGLRQGGRTYYALDVTDPGSASYPGYEWEFPHESDLNDATQAGSYLPFMGQTWGTPVVTRVRLRVGVDDNGGEGYERWAVIVTAGYDPTGDPNSPGFDPSGTRGRAVFMLDAKTGEVIAMERVDTNSAIDSARADGSAARTDATVTNTQESYALAAGPAVIDLDFDGFADLVYVTDIGGNVWKWVIQDIGEDRVNDGSGLVSQPSWTFRKHFKAPTANDGGVTLYKSFFFPPSATLYRNKLYLAFGSGERTNLGFEGPTNKGGDNNRFYVTTDLDPFELRATPLPVLEEIFLTNVTASAACQSVSNLGFYIVANNGEKFVTNSEIFARQVIVASFTPTDVLDPCETGGGVSTLYVFDVLCSEGFFGPPGSPSRTLSLDKGFPTDPRVSAGVDGQNNRVFIEKSRAELESILGPDLDNTGNLLYWREMP